LHDLKNVKISVAVHVPPNLIAAARVHSQPPPHAKTPKFTHAPTLTCKSPSDQKKSRGSAPASESQPQSSGHPEHQARSRWRNPLPLNRSTDLAWLVNQKLRTIFLQLLFVPKSPERLNGEHTGGAGRLHVNPGITHV
jgi:hypothetical protein